MTLRALRLLAGLSLLATGAVHLQQYVGAGYRSIPTIGVLFLLNTIASAIVALGLLSPVEAVVSGRRGPLVLGLLAVTGAAIALGSLAALYVSENGTLFGFHESGSGGPVLAAIVAEAAALAATVPLAVVYIRRAVSPAGEPRPRTGWRSQSSPT